jgi:hypothetical protein
MFRILDKSRLKSFYCLDLLLDDSGKYVKDKKFIGDFCKYFGRASPSHPGLCASISRLSYRLTVWEFVPATLTPSELAEMEYELSFEEVPEDDLRDIKEGFRELWGADPHVPTPSSEDGWDASGEESCDSEDADNEGRYIDASHAYDWTRICSKSWKMPLKASWDDYWEDDMAMTVKEYVEGRNSCGPPYPPRRRNSIYPHCVRHGGPNSLHSSDWGETPVESGEEDAGMWNVWSRTFRKEMQESSCAWHTREDGGGHCIRGDESDYDT